MPVVLVHGNPATADVWTYLLPHLEQPQQEIIRLSPPGFGAPVPTGFVPSVHSYRDWLLERLRQIPGPIDLVGHDWGGAHVLNAVMAEPLLVRSWVSDAIGLFHPDYRWHDNAAVWQTDGAGERWLEEAFADGAADLVRRMVEQRCDPVIARKMADGFVPGMPECILGLYRSAAQPTLANLGQGLKNAAARPGLVLMLTDDAVMGTFEQRLECARFASARTAILDGYEHWWPTEGDGEAGAKVLTEFWRQLN